MREFWFSFFSPETLITERKMTRTTASEFCQFLSELYECEVECYRGVSEKLDGHEEPFAVRQPSNASVVICR